MWIFAREKRLEGKLGFGVVALVTLGSGYPQLSIDFECRRCATPIGVEIHSDASKEQEMLAAFPSKLAGALTAAALLAGCATRPDATIADSPRGPVIVAEPRPKSRILQFCEDYEMVCILGGIAVFAATAVAIDKSGD